jgi:hypothetical protein
VAATFITTVNKVIGTIRIALCSSYNVPLFQNLQKCINRNIVYFSIVISLIKLEIEVSYFLILPFPPTIKLTATIELKY